MLALLKVQSINYKTVLNTANYSVKLVGGNTWEICQSIFYFFPKQYMYVNVQYNTELLPASQFFEGSYAVIHNAKYSS